MRTAARTRPPAGTDIELPPLAPRLRRLVKHPRLMHYNRLMALVLAVNLAYAWYGLVHGGIATDALGHTALANFALAILGRQQYVVNLLFRLATAAPRDWPLKVRWMLGKVYHHGGLHAGGAVAGTSWSLALTCALTFGDVDAGTATLAASYAVAAILIMMVVTALPPLRARFHDRFEKVHRFGGWTVLLLIWIQTALNDTAPSLWVLAVLTTSIVLPWLRLRRVPVITERPSSHVAVVHFDYGVTPWSASTTTMSRGPLREWHSFAVLPPLGPTGYRLTISRAGDWTGAFIDDLPTHVWVRGIPTAGIGKIESLFRKIVYFTTGSGIGPCLYTLMTTKQPALLVWVTRSPRATYGDALVEEVLAAQPDARIWDTTQHGKPDMLRLAYSAFREFGAEAVICVSNKQLTWQVVHGLERRGIPAYGPIWDS